MNMGKNSVGELEGYIIAVIINGKKSAADIFFFNYAVITLYKKQEMIEEGVERL